MDNNTLDPALSMLLGVTGDDENPQPPKMSLRTTPRGAKKDQERFVELQIGHLVIKLAIGDFSRLCSQTPIPNSVPVDIRIDPIVETGDGGKAA